MKTKALTLAVILLVAFATMASATTHFPAVEASNLEGREFVLPRELEGDVTLVFIAFQREQQPLVESWLPEAARVERR